ncbi:MAG: hypothetical protein IPN86_08770 [Saprospiraceae bacterium]|nr:hypothetical protein [Saprospiraceae bacterium]
MNPPETATTKLEDLMPYDKNIFIEGIDIFKITISERRRGMSTQAPRQTVGW